MMNGAPRGQAPDGAGSNTPGPAGVVSDEGLQSTDLLRTQAHTLPLVSH